MTAIPKAVERGATLLDEKAPGWEGKIDLDELRMEDGCHCVLGQVFGEYERALDELGLNYRDDEQHGFDAGSRGVRTYDRLTEFWERLIRRRRGE